MEKVCSTCKWQWDFENVDEKCFKCNKENDKWEQR